MVDMSNLRTSVPVYDTEDYDVAWDSYGYAMLKEFNDLELPCAMSVGTRRIIFQVLLAMNATDVLEIGTYTGSSVMAMALAMHLTHGRVVSVDIKDVNAQDSYWSQTQRPYAPNQKLRIAGLSHRVDFVAMDSVAFLQNTTRRFDFICIDGWHEEEPVYAEIALAIERLKPNGLIFMDDVQTNGPPPNIDVIEGPWKALQRHLMEQKELRATFVNRTLEGEIVALAFLTRDGP